MIPTSGIYWNNYGKGRFSLLDIVKELVCDLRITRVPCLPEYYEGVCNWKGNFIPIVSLRSAGGLDPLQDEDNVMQGLILSQRQPDWNAVF